jgi:hypothetical protein
MGFALNTQRSGVMRWPAGMSELLTTLSCHILANLLINRLNPLVQRPLVRHRADLFDKDFMERYASVVNESSTKLLPALVFQRGWYTPKGVVTLAYLNAVPFYRRWTLLVYDSGVWLRVW